MHIRYFLLVSACFAGACCTSAPAPVSTPAPVPAPVVNAAAVSPAIEATARGVVANLAAGHPAEATGAFDTTMKAALAPAKLDEVWRSLVAQYGAYQTITEATMTEEAGYRVVFLWLRFEHGNVTTKVVFNASGEVAGLFFLPVRQEQPGSTR